MVRRAVYVFVLLGLLSARAFPSRAVDPSVTSATLEQLQGGPELAPTYVRIGLRYSGVYRVYGRELTKAGVDLSQVDLKHLGLWNEGEPVPLNVRTYNTRYLSPDDCLEFIGDYPHGSFSTFKPYNTYNNYFLNWTTTSPLHYRETVIDADGHTVRDAIYREHRHCEIDIAYHITPLPPGITDFFFWDMYTAAAEPSPRKELDFPGFVDIGEPARVSFRLFGFTNVPSLKPTHKFGALYDDYDIGTFQFNGVGYHDFATSIPGSRIKARGYTQFYTPEDRKSAVDKICLDSFDVSYPRRLDAGQRELYSFNNQLVNTKLPATVILRNTLSGARVFAPEDGVIFLGKDAANSVVVEMSESPTTYTAVAEDGIYPADSISVCHKGTDVTEISSDTQALILYHSDVGKAALAYTRYRQQSGLRCSAVNVEEIFDRMGHGFMDDVNLKRYIRFVADTAPSLRYVVLFGGSTFDYRQVNYDETEEWDSKPFKILIPIHWISYLSVNAGGYPDDNWYGSFRSANTPDVAIGRIPAHTEKEGFDYLRKLIEYEQLQLSAKDKALLISSVEASFQDLINQTKKTFVDHFSTSTVLFPETKEATLEVQRLREQLESGVQLVYYVGHGGARVWRVGPVDYKRQKDLFTPADALLLHNRAHYPIIVCSSCYTTSFDYYSSLGQTFVLQPEAGGIAIVGTPWKSTVYDDHSFNSMFFDAYLNPKTQRLGDAFLHAKQANRPRNPDQVDFQSFTLLGDPCLKLVPRQ